MSPPATASSLLQGASAVLVAAGVPDAAGDARRLLAHALGIARDRLTLALHDPVTPAQIARFDALVQGRATRVPVSHLTGRRAFWGRDFIVTPDVLDPRPETETLIAAALEAPFERVIDLGTGSGCILLTLLAERPATRGTGTDISAAARAVAARNADALGVTSRARLIAADWWDSVDGMFDLIVANPPYIAADEMPGLSPEVRDHEPQLALTDGADGLTAYRAILCDAARHLAPEGRVALEVGPTQAADVVAIAARHGLGHGRVMPDLDGRDRVVILRHAQARIAPMAFSACDTGSVVITHNHRT